MKRRRSTDALAGVLGILLALGGNLLGNPVSDALSWPITQQPLIPLVVTAVLILGVALLRRAVSGDVSAQRSLLRKRVTLGLVLVYELLWAAGGVLSNRAAGQLSPDFQRYAGFSFVAVLAVGMVLAAFDFRVQSAPTTLETSRHRFLRELESRYSHRLDDALRGGAVHLGLGLDGAPAAAAQPALTAGVVTQDSRELSGRRPVPAGTPISEVYQSAHGQLLILGAPGSGKSTLLVELGLYLASGALAADARARAAKSQPPMPVLFNLASWQTNHRPLLAEWLIEDLQYTYQVAPHIAQAWVDAGTVLPLLDGLDEIADIALRSQCVQAMNDFHAGHEDLPLVVCSRRDDYMELPLRLVLRQAVEAEPLTDDQINQYLDAGGAQLAVLRQAMDAHSALREVVRTPLMLHLVTMTYKGLPAERIPPVGDAEAWRRHLFERYIDTMLRRPRGPDEWEHALAGGALDEVEPRYTPDETRRYLAWLARTMRTQGLVEFYLERMQPEWLPMALSRVYRGVFWLYFGAVVALFGAAGGALLGAVGGVLGVGLGVGLGGGVVLRLRSGPIEPRASIRGTWSDGLRAGLFGPRGGWLYGALVIGSFAALVGALIGALLGGRDGTLLGGLIGGLVGLLLGALAGARRGALIVALFGLSGEAPAGSPLKDEGSRTPNEGIHRSAWNGVKSAMVVGPVAGLAFGLPSGLAFGLRDGLIVGLFVGLFVGLIAGLGLGGAAALQHLALRWALRQGRLVPPHLVRFLDYAAQKVLLQPVGGGYRFMHIMLRDYLADLGSDAEAPHAVP
jgi:hypothetical protein